MRLSNAQLRAYLGGNPLGGGCCGGSALGSFGNPYVDYMACLNASPVPQTGPQVVTRRDECYAKHPFTQDDVKAAGGFVGKTVDETSASSQGLNPAPNGDTWAQLVANYPRQKILDAIAWNGFRDGGIDAREWADVATIYTKALGGDSASRKYATASMAYYAAAGYPPVAGAPPGGGVDPAALAEQLKAKCASLPSWAQGACLKAVEEGEQKGGDALEKLLNKLPGTDGGPPPAEEASSGLPIWAYALLGIAGLKVFRII